MENFTNKTVLVHIPYPLLQEANIAPQIRPRKMIEAFKGIGANVVVVAGDTKQRRKIIRQIKARINEGSLRVAMVYSESAGWPNAFSEGRKLSFHPFLDVRFLKFLSRAKIPVRLFYRDAYHRTPEFMQVPWFQKPGRMFLTFLAKYDLRQYNSYVSILYLPSLDMKRAIPEYRGEVYALPPGAVVRNGVKKSNKDTYSGLSLLYVGGMGDHYRLHEFFAAVAERPEVELTICTRPADWTRVQSEYQPYLKGNICVVHRQEDQLQDLYQRCDIAVLAFEAHPYRQFAVPVKLFEYIGAGKPVLATRGTFAGQYVSNQDLGWTVEYSQESFEDFFVDIFSANGRADIKEKSDRAFTHRSKVTWEARARQAMADLSE